MKVILLQNIPGLGNAGDVKDVSPNQARNSLFPTNKAKPATPEAVKKIEKEKKNAINEVKEHSKALQKTANALSGLTVTFKEKTNEQGTLFAGIDAKQIAEAIQKQHSLTIEPQMIKLKEHIKHTGSTQVPFRVTNDLTGEFTVQVDTK